MKNKSIPFLALVIFMIAFTSCVTNRKLVYLQDAAPADTFKIERNSYFLQPGDILSVKVYSTDPIISSFFNVEPTNAAGGQGAGGYMTGYSISDSGYIHIPVIGKVYLMGKTREEAQKIVYNEVKSMVTDATVVVKLLSFKFSILGEVRSPGHYYAYNNRLNLFEALGMAGDLTLFGNRKKIKLLRTTLEGTVMYNVDLTEKSVINSPMFQLLPNDVIYVEPVKAQAFRANSNVIPLILTGVSTLVVILNFVLR